MARPYGKDIAKPYGNAIWQGHMARSHGKAMWQSHMAAAAAAAAAYASVGYMNIKHHFPMERIDQENMWEDFDQES